MPEQTDITPESTSAAEPQTAETNAEVFTREQIAELIQAEVKKARDSAFAEARRMFKAEPAPKQGTRNDRPEKTDKGETKSDADRLSRMLRQRDALDDVLAGKPVTAEQRRTLRALMEQTDPDDPAAWAESFLSTFLVGAAPKGEASPAPTPSANPNPVPKQPTQEAPVPPKPPQSDAGAPQALPVWERPSNPFEWTAEDIARLEAMKGKREAQRIIRRKAEEYARNIRLQVVGRR